MTIFNVNIRERVVIPLTVRPKVTFTLAVNDSTIGLPGPKGDKGDPGSSFISGFMHTGIVTGRNINVVAIGYTPTLKEIIRVIPDSEIVNGSVITLSINGGTPVVIHEYTSHDILYSLVLVFLDDIWGVLARQAESYTINGVNTGDNVTSGIAAPIIIPSKIGNMYVDTINRKLYFATGTSSSSDWVLLN